MIFLQIEHMFILFDVKRREGGKDMVADIDYGILIQYATAFL